MALLMNEARAAAVRIGFVLLAGGDGLRYSVAAWEAVRLAISEVPELSRSG